ncbi:DUF1932 domain-containing protein [Salinibacterium sp. SYSU T00001]|uniref:NAD(P)-dependent oxidoreductase n=1 Tax=Homoserinimonas sedimenticola TaxID=2986805 RepID=UPI002235D579|nr:NAD(P)-dependent oxidoreductase [Salinibacterium sedimenticola]MCW4386039.1 DUF1932 domain-containing protein [Salinibacterium sedimenticola]
MSRMVRIAVLGLGAAGRVYAEDLARVAAVVGHDPFLSQESGAFAVAESAADAVKDAEIILAMTPSTAARAALDSVLGHAARGAVYADLSSSGPADKAASAAAAEKGGLLFADAVLMAPVAHKRIATPVVASGPGAARMDELLTPLGMPVEVLDGPAGEAAARKLLRSIVVKGITGLMIESLRAAEQQGLLEWFGDHVTETLTHLTPDFLRGLLEGTMQHSARRVHEMEAAAEMIEQGGDAAAMARATMAVLESIGERGIPRGGALR